MIRRLGAVTALCGSLALYGACAGAAVGPETAPHAEPARPASAREVDRDAGAPTDGSAEASAPRSRAGGGPIGTAGPITFEQASPDAGWVVFCQAREDTNGDGKISVDVLPGGRLSGDRLERHFSLGSGDGTPIEALAASDPTGRWVVLLRKGRAILVDTATSRETDLSALRADARNDALPFRRHRAFAFDGVGARLAYLRRDGDKSSVAVLDLESSNEALVDPGPGEVWRVGLDYSGRHVVLEALVDDTNRDQRLTWPAPVAKAPPPCRGPVAPYSAWVGRGDKPVTKTASAEGGSAELASGFVTFLGDGRVLREPGGRLVLDEAGARVELAPARCGAKVVHADQERRLLVVACTGAKGRAPLELVGPGLRIELGAQVGSFTGDQTAGAPTRLVGVYPGSDSALVDLVQRKLLALKAGDVVLATRGAKALLRRGTKLLSLDVDASQESLVFEPLTDIQAVVERDFVAIAPVVVSTADATLLGAVAGKPLAVAPDGRVLVAGGGDADATQLALGPLHWVAPTLAPKAGPTLDAGPSPPDAGTR